MSDIKSLAERLSDLADAALSMPGTVAPEARIACISALRVKEAVAIIEQQAARIAQLEARNAEPVAWQIATPEGMRPSLAFTTTAKRTVDHYAEQGWRVIPLCLAAHPQSKGEKT